MTGSATLLVNSVDLRTATGVKVVSSILQAVMAPGTLRGSNDAPAGRRGQIGADLPLDAFIMEFQLQVAGASPHVMISNLRAFLWAIRGSSLSSLCTLERRLDNGTTYDATTAHGQITGNAVTALNHITGRTTLEIVNLDGAWTTDGGTTWVFP
jgi:hypothetical protein